MKGKSVWFDEKSLSSFRCITYSHRETVRKRRRASVVGKGRKTICHLALQLLTFWAYFEVEGV